MGVKRSRSSLKRVPGGEVSTAHPQSLVDDVRQLKDVEFAALKKHTDRTKRRKISDQQQLELQTKQYRALKRAAKKGNVKAAEELATRKDPRKAGLQVWKDAAVRRAKGNGGDGGDGGEEDVELSDLHEKGVDNKLSNKILEEAKLQRVQIRDEGLEVLTRQAAQINANVEKHLHGVGDTDKMKVVHDDDSDDDDDHSDGEVTQFGSEHEEEIEIDFLDASKITEEEEVALQLFAHMRAGPEGDANGEQPANDGPPRIMLADLILDKLREKEEMEARAAEEAADPERAERNRKIAQVYGLVGTIMSRYRSGKVPKAFKVIPKQPNWQDLLYMTRPDEWSPAAVYVATRLLASNLSDKQVVNFYNDILLPRCMEDIAENKKLNYHLYRSLGKAVYKPAAFSKGILFPVCEDRSCSLRQATIIGSVLTKVSIPMLHSAAALFYITQMPYSAPNSIIITALLEKKYALPFRVVDAVVDSFLQMKSDSRSLPLLWHNSMLVFAQRYKTELTSEQKEKLKLLMRVHTHHSVTQEIRRELFSSRNRGDTRDPDANTIARNVADANMMTD